MKRRIATVLRSEWIRDQCTFCNLLRDCGRIAGNDNVAVRSVDDDC